MFKLGEGAANYTSTIQAFLRMLRIPYFSIVVPSVSSIAEQCKAFGGI
ncbi:MAG: hypothetical protein IPM63_18665 [Acidobacteriota bacterium]|nr:MAG: hypothetical protein IPM63_18665 [Acidobacteriota bacterium]